MAHRLLILSILVLANAGAAHATDRYMFLLDPSSPEADAASNLVYTLDSNGDVVVATNRLHLKLAGTGVNLSAISSGNDEYLLGQEHGRLLYILESTQSTGPEVPPWNDASFESQKDYEADIWLVENVPVIGQLRAASKAVEENSANLPRRANTVLFTEELQLTGGYTGQDWGMPSKIRGFDKRTYSPNIDRSLFLHRRACDNRW